MKEIMLALIPVVATESIALFVMFFKTIPVMQSKLETMEKNETQNEIAFDGLKQEVADHKIKLAESNKDHQRLKSDLDDTRLVLKENNTELRKTLEDNTKAIIGLETTIKMLAPILSSGNNPLPNSQRQNP